MGEAKRIFGASSRTEAIRQFKAWRARWLDEAETAVHCLEKDLFHCLHYFRFPEGTMENHSDHQYPRTGLPGSPAKDEAHGRIYQRRIGGADHVWSHEELKRQLGGASPSENSTELLT